MALYDSPARKRAARAMDGAMLMIVILLVVQSGRRRLRGVVAGRPPPGGVARNVAVRILVRRLHGLVGSGSSSRPGTARPSGPRICRDSS